MPVYEYACLDCKKKFSETKPVAAYDPKRIRCPKCNSKKVERRWSSVFRGDVEEELNPGIVGPRSTATLCSIQCWLRHDLSHLPLRNRIAAALVTGGKGENHLLDFWCARSSRFMI